MEIRRYLGILRKYWWILLAAFSLTLISTLIFVSRQPWIYESRTTSVMRPYTSIAGGDEAIRVVDTLSRRVEISTTYAEIANSELIKEQSIARLSLSAQERKGLKIKSKVVAGTNVIEIRVQGTDPILVRDLANAVSGETYDYVRNLYNVFELEPLDQAEIPKKPIGPNKTLNLALGGIFGLMLGTGLVFLLEYLNEPSPGDINFNILDPETGAYNKPYFMLRLRQEMSRAVRQDYSLSLALIKISQRGFLKGHRYQVPADKALQIITYVLGDNLRHEDILAHLGKSTFALFLPDTSVEATIDLLESVRSQIGLLSPLEYEGDKGRFLCTSVGITTYQDSGSGMTEDELLAQAIYALEGAETAVLGKVNTFFQIVTYSAKDSSSNNSHSEIPAKVVAGSLHDGSIG